MKMTLLKACCFGCVVTGCSQHLPVLVPVTALKGCVSLTIPVEWGNHQVLHGWASDCNGCSYSEPSDYFGEDSLVQTPITPPTKSFCVVGSTIQPGSFSRSFPFKPDIKAAARALKQKDPSATDEEIIVSPKTQTVEVSYTSQFAEKGLTYYHKSITYFGPNRRVRVSFKGKDSPKFRETVAAMRNNIRIEPAFLNEEIDK